MDKKQIVLVAAQTLRHFLNEIPNRFADLDSIIVRRSGQIETPHQSFRFISNVNSLRGFHGIKFEVWGPSPHWIDEEALALIRCAEMP